MDRTCNYVINKVYENRVDLSIYLSIMFELIVSFPTSTNVYVHKCWLHKAQSKAMQRGTEQNKLKRK